MPTGYQISVNMDQVEAWALKVSAEAPDVVKAFTRVALTNAAVIVKEREQKEAPVGISSDGLSKSIQSMVSELAAVIRPTKSYAGYVEGGTKPHMPPVDMITPWAQAHGMNPWALAKSIAQKGTKANPFVKRTYDATKEPVIEEFRAAVKLINKSLGQVVAL